MYVPICLLCLETPKQYKINITRLWDKFISLGCFLLVVLLWSLLKSKLIVMYCDRYQTRAHSAMQEFSEFCTHLCPIGNRFFCRTLPPASYLMGLLRLGYCSFYRLRLLLSWFSFEGQVSLGEVTTCDFLSFQLCFQGLYVNPQSPFDKSICQRKNPFCYNHILWEDRLDLGSL